MAHSGKERPRRSLSGGVSAAGEPASSTAAGRQSRVESSAGGTSSNRGPLSRPRRPVARRTPATRRSDRVQQDLRAPDSTGPGLQHAPSRTSQDAGTATGTTPSGWTEYVDNLVLHPSEQPSPRSPVGLTKQPIFMLRFRGQSRLAGTPQIQQVYGAMNPLLAYALAPMHLPAFYIPRGNGKTTWEPVSTSTSTATPCFRAEISGSEPPGRLAHLKSS
ncbi:hypothetical protein THAOC_33439, partial [Thalassiosira oceanica]